MTGSSAPTPPGTEGRFALKAFRQFRGGLYRYLLRKLHNAENAEDLVQEVYLRLLRTADRQMVRNPQAYVFGVAFNVLYEFKLHEQQEPVSFDSDIAAAVAEQLPDDTTALDEDYDRRRKARWLEHVLARLSPMQYAVLLMAKRQGLSHADIAAKLGISIGTVRKHLARAIAHCRQAPGA